MPYDNLLSLTIHWVDYSTRLFPLGVSHVVSVRYQLGLEVSEDSTWLMLTTVFHSMPGCWTGLPGRVGNWSSTSLSREPLQVTSLGFLTAWQPQGVELLRWCLALPRVSDGGADVLPAWLTLLLWAAGQSNHRAFPDLRGGIPHPTSGWERGEKVLCSLQLFCRVAGFP